MSIPLVRDDLSQIEVIAPPLRIPSVIPTPGGSVRMTLLFLRSSNLRRRKIWSRQQRTQFFQRHRTGFLILPRVGHDWRLVAHVSTAGAHLRQSLLERGMRGRGLGLGLVHQRIDTAFRGAWRGKGRCNGPIPRNAIPCLNHLTSPRAFGEGWWMDSVQKPNRIP